MGNVRKCKNYQGDDGVSFPVTDRHRTFICLCWAQFMGYDETIGAFLHRFDVHIKRHVALDEKGEIFDQPAVREFVFGKIDYVRNHPNASKWRKLKEKLRREWNQAYFDEWIANKRPRIQKLQSLYEEIAEAVEKKETVSKSIKVGSDEWEKVIDLHIMTRVNILREARHETEPDFLGLLDLDVSSLTDEQLKRLEEGENIISVFANSGGSDT